MASYKDTQRALYAVAATQGGYFTARQAREAGYSYSDQSYHVARDNWERVKRGIFRLREYPSSEREDLILFSLMTHDRNNQPQAVFSHETALSFHELGDANPRNFELTVPPHFRRRLPSNFYIHYDVLTPADWNEYDGFRVTTPLRTLIDVADSASWPFLDSAVRDAIRTGAVTRSELLEAETTEKEHRRLVDAIHYADEMESMKLGAFW